MKKLFIRGTLCLLCALLLFSSCGKAPKMEYENGVFTNSKTGISYLPASVNYEAISYQGDTPVARIIQKGMGDLLVYRMSGVAPEKMLSSAHYELFYAVGTTLPTLAEMAPVKVHLCRTAADSIYSLASLDKKDDLAVLVDCYQNGVSFPAADMVDSSLERERYDLKFESKTHPGIYFCLTYWQFDREVLVYEDIKDPNLFVSSYPGVEVEVEPYEDGSGEYYAEYHFGTRLLYDRANDTCYYFPSDLLDQYTLEPKA